MNIANLKQLRYCTATWNGNTCDHVAQYKAVLIPKRVSKQVHKNEIAYRCHMHRHTGTVFKKIIKPSPYNQHNQLQCITNYLFTLYGKIITSNIHSARQLEVKQIYLNGSVKCIQPVKGIVKVVFYHQIKQVL